MVFHVTAVVVSHNRAALLKECLDGLQQQTRKPDRVIVVDNASTDDSALVAQRHPLPVHLLQLQHNLGGAGGFCAGMALALQDDSGPGQSCLWIMDDDTIAQATALEELLLAFREAELADGVRPAALGSQALWVDGRVHLMNKPRPRTFVSAGESQLVQSAGAFQVRSLSFVSCLLNADAIRQGGFLPISDYFLWNDDFQFTTRLLRRGIGYYVPASQVVHKTKVFGSSDADPGSRFFFEVRNKLWMLRTSSVNFSRLELLEFVLKTFRRWVLTYARSGNRHLIASYFKRGLGAAVRSQPRSNAMIFAEEPKIAAAIERVEGREGR